MKDSIKIFGLQGIPLINPGDAIANLIIIALKKSNLSLENGDILVIAQTIISKSIGRIRNLKDITPSREAIELYNKIKLKAKKIGIPIKEPELIQAILEESKEIVKAEHVLIVETKHGYVCANAGIDKSNVKGEGNITLLPEDPDAEALKIRKVLKKKTNKDVAVIISDSFGRPFRVGAVGVALGVSGITAILDKRGSHDLFGHELQSTIVAQADNLASTAQLIMGESDEGIPVVLIRGYEFKLDEGASIKKILRDKENDLFRKNDLTKNLVQALKNRRSYKFNFDSRKVEKEIIEECIEIARWAPNAHNAQAWRFIILEKDETRSRLIKAMNEMLRADLTRDGKTEEIIKNKINKTNKQFLDAPFLILLCLDEKDLETYSDTERSQNEYIMGVQSVSASATYLLLAFESRNLATCWYCAPLFSKNVVKSTLKLPKSFIPMAFFTVGYSLKTPKAPKRKELKDIIINR